MLPKQSPGFPRDSSSLKSSLKCLFPWIREVGWGGWGWQNNGIMESLRLEKPSKIIKSRNEPSTTVLTTNHIPKCCTHTLCNPSREKQNPAALFPPAPSFSPAGIWEPNKNSQELLSLVKSFIYRMGNIYNVILIQKELTGNTERRNENILTHRS